MMRKPNSECQIMVFRPTMEEFSDFARYIQYMESQGAHRGGVAKIIPPKEWSPCKSYDDIDNLAIPAPISQVVTGQKGLYTQYNIQQKTMTVKEMRRLTNTDRYASPFHESYEDLERTYWKNITFNPAIYGADISGSLYDKDVDVWNISRLDTILDLVENNTGVKIEGVNTAYLYFGMWKTSFAWHTEDMDLYSINYVHFGAPKTWYSVPPEHGKRLERLACGFFPHSNSTCPAFLRHKMTLISPSVLRQYGIPFNKVTQEAGEFMITFPYGYHSGFNHGFNCAESTNFASERWIDYGIVAEKCRCRKDMVYINMDIFIKTFKPDKYERWKANKCDEKLSYTDIPSVPDFTKPPVHWRDRVEQIRNLGKSPAEPITSPKKTPQKATTKAPNKSKQLSPKKETVGRPLGISKMPFVRLEKADMSISYLQDRNSPTPIKKISRRTLSDSTSERKTCLSPGNSGCLATPMSENLYQLKMGTVLSGALSSNESKFVQMSDLGGNVPANFPTLSDRIKMSRRKLQSESSLLYSSGNGFTSDKSTSVLPPNSDHNMYTKRTSNDKLPNKTSKIKSYPPLPVKMQILNPKGSPFSHLRALPPDFKWPDSQGAGVSRIAMKATTHTEDSERTNPLKFQEPAYTPTTGDSGVSVPEFAKVNSPPHEERNLQSPQRDTKNTIPDNSTLTTQGAFPSSPLITNRPPLKRRHPVSKKGPSKKSSPTVVLKSGSADSESSEEETSSGIATVKKPRGRPRSKSKHFVESEGYPTLWPRRKASFKTEKQYNATVAKLPPHCAICTLFHPYYQRSLNSNEKPPPFPELLEKAASLPSGTRSTPLIPEIIFATSIDNPAPLATCEFLDSDGKSILIQCKVCKVQVHASCYGIAKPEHPWTCDRCSFKAWIAQCSLCCMRGGALKPVNDGLQWAHILCAVAIPEVSFDDIPRRNGINIRKLSPARQKLKCTYCRRHKSRGLHLIGTCIQCCAGICAISFHPTCAHAAGVKMEPGDWPLPVFVYCHRHALQKERAMEKTDKSLPDVSVGQTVFGKHRNGRYYPCVIQSETSQNFHHVVFTDNSWSDNLFQNDIVSHNFTTSHPKQRDSVTVKWTDGKLYDAEYVECKKHQVLTVEFEDGSFLSIKREDMYTNMDEMPKRIRRKLSNATLMSRADYLESPRKTGTQSYVSQRAAFNEERKKKTSSKTKEKISPTTKLESAEETSASQKTQSENG